ncbi:MAG: galactonate dehydratase [Bryobacteraceae bacterium]|nr:galactonate dehydratase [Bryobacteraceae bacterium]
MSVSRRKALAGMFAATGIAVKTEEQLARAQQVVKNAPVAPKDGLKITRLETFLVKPRWLFLKIHTNAGIVGYGEPITEGRALTCATAVKETEPYLIGKDPRAIQHHWQAIYRHAFYRGGPILTSALSGIDQALWDIKGKALGIPVYEFFGGPTRNKVRVYAHAGTPQRMKEAMAQGFNAFKTGPSKRRPARYMETPAAIERVGEVFGELRKTVGNEADIGVDFHGAISPALAKVLIKKLEPYNPMFIEEPCQAQNHDIMADIAKSTHIPIATGERVFTKWGFQEVLSKGAATILQPDMCHAGGISEVRIIAGMAEACYASIAPHNPLGPISLASGVQLAASIPNFLIQEQVSLGEGYLKKPFTVEKGYLNLPTGPGLGIELDDNAMADKIGHNWTNREEYDEDDGSVMDW